MVHRNPNSRSKIILNYVATTLNYVIKIMTFQSNKDFFPHLNPSIFMQPGGDKFVQVLCYLASHILSKSPQCSKSVLPPNISNPTNKPSFNQQFQQSFVKGTVIVKQKRWKNLFDNFSQEYCLRKQLAR